MTATNANAHNLAMHLASVHGGSFVGLVIRKQGKVRGRGDNKKTFGDDLVHTVVVTGFKYDGLVRRSLERLATVDPDEVVAFCADKGITDGSGAPIIRAAVEKALTDLTNSFQKTLDGESKSTTEHVYEPLVVDGNRVRGCRVYRCLKNVTHIPAEDLDVLACKCRECALDEKAPKDGTIYLQGLAVGSKVLEPAPNGPIPASKSRGDVVAKNLIRRRLPIGRYVSYRLEPGSDFILRAGGVAAVAANGDGVEIREEVATDEVFEDLRANG